MTLIAGCAHCSTSIADRWGANYTDNKGNPALLCGDCWDAADGYVCDRCDQLSDDTTMREEVERSGRWLTLCGKCEKETRPVEVQS